jgi:hypothetical protein
MPRWSGTERTSEAEERTAYYAPSLRQKYALGITERMNLQSESISADIGHVPDFNKYQRRKKARLALSNLPSKVPRGWPEQIYSEMAWKGTDLISEEQYIFTVSEEEISEIKTALRTFQGIQIPCFLTIFNC